MAYNPTELDALGAYYAAATAHHLLPPDESTRPQRAWLTPFGAFNIWPDDVGDDSKRIDKVAVCLYDKSSRLWLVTLQNERIVKVNDTGAGFVVVANLPDEE